jgi:hypothetical protein
MKTSLLKYHIEPYPSITDEGKNVIEHAIWEKHDNNSYYLLLKTVGNTTKKTLKQLKEIVKFLNTNK